MTLKIVNTLKESTWRDFITSLPEANIFHTPEMFQVFSRAMGHQPSLWSVVGDDNIPLVLMLPVQMTLKNGIFFPWTTRAVVYGGILCPSHNATPDAVKLLLTEYERSMRGRILFTEIRNFSPLINLQPVLQECKFEYEDHLDYVVNLDQPEEILWQNLSKSCRKSIRLAQSRGTEIEAVENKQKLETAYQLLKNVYSRVQVPLAHFSLFEASYDICFPLHMYKVFLARLNDHYIGAAFILIFNGKILAWYAGSDRNYSTYNPGELLKWHCFKWGKEHGCHCFDFGGAGKPGESYGPRDFKAKFGGTLINYGRNTMIHSPVRMQISKAIYSAARKAVVLNTISGRT